MGQTYSWAGEEHLWESNNNSSAEAMASATFTFNSSQHDNPAIEVHFATHKTRSQQLEKSMHL
jgi:hypothetical protein